MNRLIKANEDKEPMHLSFLPEACSSSRGNSVHNEMHRTNDDCEGDPTPQEAQGVDQRMEAQPFKTLAFIHRHYVALEDKISYEMPPDQ
jgi:hypothetical protein